jgi:NAD(P)-dependent dehydrogenase (short-subunit alcohol dehydrogenase family)
MSRVKDRVVVVTGASSGIGRAAAIAFAERGATVVLAARSASALEEVAETCRGHGRDALVVSLDVRDAEAVDNLARRAVGSFGRLDVWVNNAAVNLFAPIEQAPVELWHRVVETNLLGTYHGVRAALPWMREQGRGVIINVSSVLGKLGSPYQSAYVASKHGIRAISDCTRQELRDAPGIRVCTVLPGPIDTPLFRHAANYAGRAVKPVKPVIDAHRVADAIVSCAARPRREAVVGASTAEVLGWLRIAPGLVERIAARQVDKDHFEHRLSGPWDGNLLEPIDEHGSVSGGWTRSSRQVGADDRSAVSNGGVSPKLGKAAAVGAAGVAAAAAARSALRSRSG